MSSEIKNKTHLNIPQYKPDAKQTNIALIIRNQPISNQHPEGKSPSNAQGSILFRQAAIKTTDKQSGVFPLQ